MNGKLAITEVSGLGREGVTCTVCHQTESAEIGKSSSFTGSFAIGTKDRIYGPYPEPFTRRTTQRSLQTRFPTLSCRIRNATPLQINAEALFQKAHPRIAGLPRPAQPHCSHQHSPSTN